MNMNGTYKSEQAQRVSEGVNIGNITKEREKQVLFQPQNQSAASRYDTLIAEIDSVEKDIAKIGMRSGLLGYVDRFSDSIGLSTPATRIRKELSGIENTLARLDAEVKNSLAGIEKTSERVHETKTYKRDAIALKNKYVAMEEALLTEMEKVQQERAMSRDELAKTEKRDPKFYALQEQIDSRQMELDKMADDVQQVRFKRDLAAKAVVMYDAKVIGYENERLLGRRVLDALQQTYNGLDLKRTEFEIMGERDGGHIRGVVGSLRDAEVQRERFESNTGGILERMYNGVIKLVGGIAPRGIETDGMLKKNKELQRDDNRAQSDILRMAEEIERRDRECA